MDKNANRRANGNFEEIAGATTHSFSKHGLPKGLRREKKLRNRAARKFAAKLHFDSQCTLGVGHGHKS